MGTLVCGLALSHVPELPAALQDPDNRRGQIFLQGLGVARERLQASRPEVLVIIANDHYHNFFLNNYPAFCLGLAPECEGPFEPWLRVPPVRRQVDLPVAEGLMGGLLERGFDLAFSREFVLDHGMVVPLHALTPDADLPIVPLFVNSVARPMPTMARCFALGQALREVLEGLEGERRIGVIASGGLSHWVATPQMGSVNEEFDRGFLAHIVSGAHERLAAYSNQQVEQGGNGAHELRHWMVMLGIFAAYRGEVLAYEPIPEWITGCGVVAMRLEE